MTGGSDLLGRAERLRAEVQEAAGTAGQPKLAGLLGSLPAAGDGGQVRVVVVGETNRGKSSLVNTLIGRPLLSPVSAAVMTSCWLELSYAERDESTVLLADPATPGTPRRQRIDVRDVARYVGLREVSDPVLGVEVKLPAPLLRDMVLIDTPGVGGLQEGHGQATLAALQRADALLFVCDATQPILGPEVAFLAEAASRVPAVVIAATKSDANPDFEEVVGETRTRLARHELLRGTPVFAVAASLADYAGMVEDAAMAARLRSLSGIAELAEALKRQAAAGGNTLRAGNIARVAGTVCRALLSQARESAANAVDDPGREQSLQAEVEALADLLADRGRLTAETHRLLDGLRNDLLAGFGASVEDLRIRFATEAGHGPVSRLDALAPRMIADLTALGVTTLEQLEARAVEVTSALLDRFGCDPAANRFSTTTTPRRTRPLPGEPSAAGAAEAGFATATDVFDRMEKVLRGAAAVVTFLTAPVVLGACVALAAGAGWWRFHRSAESSRRKELLAWVDSVAAGETSSFGRELSQRIREAERFLGEALPGLISTRRSDLARMRTELTELRRLGERQRQAAVAALAAQVSVLTVLAAESNEIAAAARERRPPS